MNIPRIAVLLAAYNGVSWLSEQIESILSQEGVQVTLFISVDQSTDGTEDFCVQLQARYSNVHVLPSGLRFGGASRNFFRLLRDVDFQCYDAISLADQDDIWYVNKLSRGYDLMISHKCHAYSSNVVAFWPDGREMLVEKHQPQVKFDYLFEAAGPGCTYLLTVSTALEFKSFLIDKWEAIQGVALHDWLLYAYCRSHGRSWYIDEIPTMRYRQHANNQVGVNAGLAAKKARLHQVLSGWWLNQSLSIAGLVGIRDSLFVSSWSSLDMRSLLHLAASAWKCRRRVKDKVLFFGLCMVLIVARRSMKKKS